MFKEIPSKLVAALQCLNVALLIAVPTCLIQIWRPGYGVTGLKISPNCAELLFIPFWLFLGTGAFVMMWDCIVFLKLTSYAGINAYLRKTYRIATKQGGLWSLFSVLERLVKYALDRAFVCGLPYPKEHCVFQPFWPKCRHYCVLHFETCWKSCGLLCSESIKESSK